MLTRIKTAIAKACRNPLHVGIVAIVFAAMLAVLGWIALSNYRQTRENAKQIERVLIKVCSLTNEANCNKT